MVDQIFVGHQVDGGSKVSEPIYLSMLTGERLGYRLGVIGLKWFNNK